MVGPIANSMAKIDPALIEAARRCRRQPLGAYMTDVVIPLSKTGIALGSILVFTQVMGDYFVVQQMSGGQSASVVSHAVHPDPGDGISARRRQRDAAGGVRRRHGRRHDVRIVDVRKELVK